MAEVGNPFYPSRDDLIQEVWIKLRQARTKIEKIWADPHPVSGGFRGVCRFVSRVVTNAAIDAKRRNDVRAPEILAASLDEPLVFSAEEDGVNEDCGTLADTISDEIALPQAFRLEDLQSEMSAEEFNVLYESFAKGATIRELAEERGDTRADVGRIAASAKTKARKWIEWLRRAPEKQARAHISLTFEKKPCLRPDKIAEATLDNWHDGIPVVQFHDESSEWRPPITKQPRKRATRECWNGACTNGPAIGRDNLVLPAAPRDEAVRFLPAYTGRDNRLCAGCEQAAKQAKVLQSVDTKPTCWIEHAELNVKAIPSTGQSADAQQYPDRQEQAPHFFNPAALSRTTDATRRGNTMQVETMDHKQVAEVLKALDIPRTTIARIAKMHTSDVSSWLNGNLDFSQEKVERISQVVTDIAKVVKTLTAHGIKPDLRDLDNVKHLICVANDRETQLAIGFGARRTVGTVAGD